jgi:alpha-D-ribose 1-methylphosphonate 5-triphosphate synthase subunit PhnI
MRFENEQIKLPWGDEHSRDVTSTLERELMMFGMSKKGRLESIARHDDFALALALAHWGTTEFRERIVDLDDLLGGII